MPRGLVAVLALSLLAACTSHDVGFGVALTVQFDSTVTDNALATVHTIELSASGGETYSTTLTLDHTPARTERTIYRPSAGIGDVVLTLVAKDTAGTEVAHGATPDLALYAGKTTNATVVLDATTIALPDASTADGSEPVPMDGGTIAVFAGLPGGAGSADGVGPSAYFDTPTGLAIDATTIYVVNNGSHTISAVDRSTLVATRIAGTPWEAGHDPTHLSSPFSAVATNSAVYITDSGNDAVRKIANGQLQDFTSKPTQQGPCANGMLDVPYGITTDGTKLYVTTADFTVCTIDLASGGVSLLAGTSAAYGNTDAKGTAARFSDLYGLSYASGVLYVADYANWSMRSIDLATTQVATLLGSSMQCSEEVGPPLTSAALCVPTNVLATNNTLYITDQVVIRSYALSPAGTTIPVVAGLPGTAGSTDGVGVGATFHNPRGLVPYTDSDGNAAILVSDADNSVVRSMRLSDAKVTTLLGTPPHIGHDNGARSTATFGGPRGLAVAGSTLYIADATNGAIRTITNDAVSTLATGEPLQQPVAVSIANGIAYVADLSAGALLAVNGATATVTPVLTGLIEPSGVAAGSSTVYVSDTANNRVLAVDTNGNPTPLDLGLSTTQNVGCGSGLGLIAPSGLALDEAAGKLYVAARGNCMVFVYDLTTKTATALAGSTRGTKNGIGTAAQLDDPYALALDGQGSLFVADYNAALVRRIDLVTSGVTTFAGAIGEAGIAPGARTVGHVNRPGGLAWLDGRGLVVSMPSENSLVLITAQ